MATKQPIRVEAQNPSLQNSPISKDPLPAPARADAGDLPGTCYWNGQPYSQGAQVCANGKLYQCSCGVINCQWFIVGSC
jgi:hypothetical protein